MNTRTAVATVALACLNLTAVALQFESEPVLFPGGQLLIASAGSGAVGAWDTAGQTLPQPVTGLLVPQDLAFAPDGSLYVSDSGNNLVVVTDASGEVLGTVGGDSSLSEPGGLAFGPDGSLYVASTGTDNVLVFDRQGEFASQIDADLNAPWGLAFGPEGRLYVADTGADRVAVLDPSGTLVEELDGGGQLVAPMGLCFDGRGLLWVASSGNDTVVALDADGDVVTVLEAGIEMQTPVGLCFGPDGLLYVNSSGNDRVVAFDAEGAIVRVMGIDGSALQPRGIVFAPFLYKATLKGHVQPPGAKAAKFSAKAVVSYTPGRPQLVVRLLDADDVLVSAAGSDTWILNGLLAEPAPHSKHSVFGARQMGAAASYAGFPAAQLRISGKSKSVPGADTLPPLFHVGSASGNFQHAGPQGIMTGTLKTGALIKP